MPRPSGRVCVQLVHIYISSILFYTSYSSLIVLTPLARTFYLVERDLALLGEQARELDEALGEPVQRPESGSCGAALNNISPGWPTRQKSSNSARTVEAGAPRNAGRRGVSSPSLAAGMRGVRRRGVLPGRYASQLAQTRLMQSGDMQVTSVSKISRFTLNLKKRRT